MENKGTYFSKFIINIIFTLLANNNTLGLSRRSRIQLPRSSVFAAILGFTIMNACYLTGVERTFDDNELIVSKTDLKGRVTYANPTFLHVAGFRESEILNEPHSIVRHPDMPRSVFNILWTTIEAGTEIFAYVINRAKNGDHYWVYAHVTPSYNASGELIGYHSTRRVPDRSLVDAHIVPLYRSIKEKEESFANRKEGMAAGVAMIHDFLSAKGVGYDEFVATLG